MKQMALTDATKPLLEYASELNTAADSIVLMEGEKPVAVLVSLDGIDVESFLLSLNSKFISILEQSRQEFARNQRFSLDDVKRQLATESKKKTIKNGKNHHE